MGRSPGQRIALERSSLLGHEVDGVEWAEVCAAAGADPSAELVEALLRSRLATYGSAGPAVRWSLVHGMLRESLERQAREAGRWQDHHRACALALAGRSGPLVPERRGRHLLHAGESEEAAALLLPAAARLGSGPGSGVGFAANRGRSWAQSLSSGRSLSSDR